MSRTMERTFSQIIISRLSLIVTILLLCLPSIPGQGSATDSAELPSPQHLQQSQPGSTSTLTLTSTSTSPPKSWSSRVVTTKLGLTRGFIFVPRGFEPVEIFLGLPYASPPVGSLRLMPPHAPSPWSGTKMNESPGPVCPQVFPLPSPPFRGQHTRKRSRPPFPDNDDLSLDEEVDPDGESGGGGGTGESDGGSRTSGSGSGGAPDSGDGWGLNETEILKSMPRGRLIQLQRLQPFLKNQSEDCLYLNIYVPLSVAEGKMDRPVPVLVFIHGDDYSYGGGHPYDPSMLVSQGNIIVITLNQRLGILGFLNANSDGYFKSPANFALLDQVAALHWVQENIGAFGGDKGNVTLMGHGKGAMFVNFLMISNALPSSEHRVSEALFHRVILMSGSALSPFTVGLSYGKDLAKKFAGRFKCPVEPPSNMLQCLRQLPLQYFLDSDLWKYFGPSDDGVVIESGIRENVLRDRISRFPMIFGVTKAEFLPTLTQHDAIYGIETEKRREVLKQYIDGFYSSGYRTEILAAAIHEYTDWERPVQHPISVRDETLDALADAQIVSPMVKVGELHSQGSSRTYFYVFEYQTKGSDYVQRLGCVPAEDLPYVFGVPLYLSSVNAEHFEGNEDHHHQRPGVESEVRPGLGVFSGNYTKNEVQLSHTLLQYWVNFIKTGNPNTDSTSLSDGGSPSLSLQGSGGSLGSTGENRFPHQDKPSSSSVVSAKPKLIEWPPYDSLFKKYLSIEAKPKIKNHYRAHKLSFWLYLVPELMRNGGGGISMFQNRPEGHIINSSNSTAQHPPSIQLVGPPYWEQHPFYYSGNYSSYPGGDISGPLGSRPHHRFHDYGGGGGGGGFGGGGEGFQIYSTALSVTIAVGCSLLILNILVFAAFYYFRDKRRTARHSRGGAEGALDDHLHRSSTNPGPISASGEQDPNYTQLSADLQQPHPNKRQLSYSSADTMILPSIHNTPVRLQENGQVLNMVQQQQQQQQMPQHQQLLPMPNICGDLPISANLQQLLAESGGGSGGSIRNSGNPSYQPGNPNHSAFSSGGGGNSGDALSSTLPSKQRRGPSSSLGPSFELSMPDAILAAAMMLNYRQNNSSQVGGGTGGSDFFYGTGHKSSSSSSTGTGKSRGSGLNMKEQLLLSAGISAATAAAATATSGSGYINGTGGGVGGNSTTGRTGVVLGNLPGRSNTISYNNGVAPPGDNVGPVIQFDFDNGSSKSIPRPPKRHTPTVKFSPDTFISPDESICSGAPTTNAKVNNSSGGILSNLNPGMVGNLQMQPPNPTPTPTSSSSTSISCSSSSASSSTTNPANNPQLKSSLKKHSNYSPAVDGGPT